MDYDGITDSVENNRKRELCDKGFSSSYEASIKIAEALGRPLIPDPDPEWASEQDKDLLPEGW